MSSVSTSRWTGRFRLLNRALLMFCLSLIPLTSAFAAQKDNLFSRDFQLFTGLVPGVDFLASERAEIVPLIGPIAEVRKRLQTMLGEKLPQGAIFICSSTEERDAVYEPRALRMGYQWVVMTLNAEAETREIIERMRARSGGEIPADRLERMKSRASEMQSRMVERTLLEVGFAVLITHNGEKEFQYTRLEDMNRSSLTDWLDIGIAHYAAQASTSRIAYLQRRTSEMFSIEDILTMSRPFVLPASALGEVSSGASQMGPRGGGGWTPGQAGGGPPGGGPPGGQASQSDSVPKDVRDRMMFDSEAVAFFAYLVDRIGLEKVQELIKRNRAGEETDLILAESELLGANFEPIEKEWLEWIGQQGGAGRNSQGRPGAGEAAQQ